MCRSRREPSNAYLLAKFGFDTAENEPCKVCPRSAYRFPRCMWIFPEPVPGVFQISVDRMGHGGSTPYSDVPAHLGVVTLRVSRSYVGLGPQAHSALGSSRSRCRTPSYSPMSASIS